MPLGFSQCIRWVLSLDLELVGMASRQTISELIAGGTTSHMPRSDAVRAKGLVEPNLLMIPAGERTGGACWGERERKDD